MGFGLSPLLVQSTLTPQVCGNDTIKTNPESSPFFEQWQDDIYSGLFYYLLGQAAFSMVLLAITLIGETQQPNSKQLSYNFKSSELLFYDVCISSLLYIFPSWSSFSKCSPNLTKHLSTAAGREQQCAAEDTLELSLWFPQESLLSLVPGHCR